MTTYIISSRTSRRSSKQRQAAGFGPPNPLDPLSRAGSPAGSVRVARALRSLVRACAPLTIATCVLAQGLDPAALLKPSPDSWPTYHGDYSGRRHSALTQITPENVKQLGLAWAFQTGRSDQIKASPIVVD